MAKTARDNVHSATTSDRAADWLNLNHAGRNRIKRIAQALGISPAFAKRLAAGRGWTVPRIDQAKLIWPAFQAYVFPPPETFDDRLDRVLKELSALRDQIDNLKSKLGDR